MHKPVFVKREPSTDDDLKPPADVPVSRAPVPQLDGKVEKLSSIIGLVI